jgi:VanZ family protein
VIDLRRYRHLVLTAYLVLLLAATLAPMPSISHAPSGFDKLAHVGLFAGLAFLLYWYESERTWRGAARAFGLALGAALLIEVLQALLPFRDADLDDSLAGLLGAVLGVAAAAVLRTDRAKRQASPGP